MMKIVHYFMDEILSIKNRVKHEFIYKDVTSDGLEMTLFISSVIYETMHVFVSFS